MNKVQHSLGKELLLFGIEFALSVVMPFFWTR